MSRSYYWKCNAKTSAAIVAAFAEWDATKREAHKLAKSIGAKCAYFLQPFGTTTVVGFQFAEKPKKGFRKLRNCTDGYAPKFGTDLEKKIRGMQCKVTDVARKLVGVDEFVNTDNGFSLNMTRVATYGGIVYLVTKTLPTKGGKRISDIQFEAVEKKGKQT